MKRNREGEGDRAERKAENDLEGCAVIVNMEDLWTQRWRNRDQSRQVVEKAMKR